MENRSRRAGVWSAVGKEANGANVIQGDRFVDVVPDDAKRSMVWSECEDLRGFAWNEDIREAVQRGQ